MMALMNSQLSVKIILFNINLILFCEIIEKGRSYTKSFNFLANILVYPTGNSLMDRFE